MTGPPVIAVLGASGLIGQSVTADLIQMGFPVVPVARRFTTAQVAVFSGEAVTCPIATLDVEDVSELLEKRHVDIVVNCLGVLQDSPGDRTKNVHRGFVERLVKAFIRVPRQMLLVHISIPGSENDDRTEFSHTKRAGERLIAESQLPFVILRPGFVIAPNAYGGSALFRALAALPLGLPEQVANCTFAAVAASDVSRTIIFVAEEWSRGERNWQRTWDVMERHPSTVGETLAAFRRYLGGPKHVLRPPSWLLKFGARVGDFIALLGWRPPIRSTSLSELQRGVAGDPLPWITATGIEPASLRTILAHPSTIQERWFARLYLTKTAIIAALAFFWIASGFIALVPAFEPASAILKAHGFHSPQAEAITIVSSLIDMGVGLAIAWKYSCRAGLYAGIGVSLFYMIAAAIITPDLWIEPLGALVKTLPAIILMIVALSILEDR